ncbi:hypothetical protein M9H77_34765 [Catharanthus roseus]|uniref:Uncharacterized protein n=1 Tax=Catharanthus roseus TaxID=4058 RepID=A0ACB9ZQQ6_CATRO|nr:hypothetical protein M9H77_34765 [Catharanthus roseus]
MVKVKNANVGREENYDKGGSSRVGRTRKRKGKKVASEVRLPERFISVEAVAKFEEWTRKRRKIALGHRVDLSDMEDLRNYLQKEKFLTRHDDRNVNKLDAYGKLLHHMISNIIIPNVGHKSSIINMNFGFMAVKHMAATQTSSTKCLTYGCFLTKVFQYFVLHLVGIGDHIGIGKIYNKHTFRRMEFSKNEEGMLVIGGQEDDDESDEEEEEEEYEGQDAMNVDEEVSEEELEEETFRREIRQKKRQERVEKGQSSRGMSQLMEIITSMQASMNSRFDAPD